MEEEDLEILSDEDSIAELYDIVSNIASTLSHKHDSLAIAAVLNAVAMSIYKTTLDSSDYDRMAKTIYELRNEVNTFKIIDDLNTSETIH